MNPVPRRTRSLSSDPADQWFDLCVQERDVRRNTLTYNILSCGFAIGGAALLMQGGAYLGDFANAVVDTLDYNNWPDMQEKFLENDISLLGRSLCSAFVGADLMFNRYLYDTPDVELNKIAEKRHALQRRHPDLFQP